MAKSIAERKTRVTGHYFAPELQEILNDVKNSPSVPNETIDRVRNILGESSPWSRIKEDGIRGFVDAASIGAAKTLLLHCKKVGILLNPEGESEGFCRDVSRSNKPTWLANVLSRDMKIDPELEAARTFASDLRLLMRQAMLDPSNFDSMC